MVTATKSRIVCDLLRDKGPFGVVIDDSNKVIIMSNLFSTNVEVSMLVSVWIYM